MSKRRNKNKNKGAEVMKSLDTFVTFTPEPEFPKFRYLTSYKIGKEYKGFNWKETGKHIINSQERVLQYKKSADGEWYDIPEESAASGPNDTSRSYPMGLPWMF